MFQEAEGLPAIMDKRIGLWNGALERCFVSKFPNVAHLFPHKLLFRAQLAPGSYAFVLSRFDGGSTSCDGDPGLRWEAGFEIRVFVEDVMSNATWLCGSFICSTFGELLDKLVEHCDQARREELICDVFGFAAVARFASGQALSDIAWQQDDEDFASLLTRLHRVTSYFAMCFRPQMN